MGVVLFSVGLTLTAGTVHGQRVPAEIRAAIVLRSIAYEAQLSGGSGDLRLGVVRGASGTSQRDAEEMGAVFARLGQTLRIGGRRLRVSSLAHQDVARTLSTLRRSNLDVVYIPTGLQDGPALASGVAEQLVVCGDPATVGRGCVLSVERNGSGSRVVVDVARARRGGFRFNSRLLRLSRLVQ